MAFVVFAGLILVVSSCFHRDPAPTHAEHQAVYDEAVERLNSPLVRILGATAIRDKGQDCPVAERIVPRYWSDADLDRQSRYELIVTCTNGLEYDVEMNRDGSNPSVVRR